MDTGPANMSVGEWLSGLVPDVLKMLLGTGLGLLGAQWRARIARERFEAETKKDIEKLVATTDLRIASVIQSIRDGEIRFDEEGKSFQDDIRDVRDGLKDLREDIRDSVREMRTMAATVAASESSHNAFAAVTTKTLESLSVNQERIRAQLDAQQKQINDHAMILQMYSEDHKKNRDRERDRDKDEHC